MLGVRADDRNVKFALTAFPSVGRSGVRGGRDGHAPLSGNLNDARHIRRAFHGRGLLTVAGHRLSELGEEAFVHHSRRIDDHHARRRCPRRDKGVQRAIGNPDAFARAGADGCSGDHEFDLAFEDEKGLGFARVMVGRRAEARRILSDKGTLTIPEAAEAAGISRATAYRYFSDASVLAAEAGIDVTVKPYEDIVRDCADARERVLAVALFFFDQAIEHETEFRSFLSRWLDTWRLNSGAPRRGGRRVEMFRSAVEDMRDEIGDAACERLVRELSVATGTEAMIALLDVVGTDPATARATVEHMVGALYDASLGER